MDLAVRQGSLPEAVCDALIVNLFEGVKAPGGGTGAVDRALGGAITGQIEAEEFQGRLGDVMVVQSCGRVPAKQVLVVGLGKGEQFGVPQILRASGAAVRKCRDLRARNVASIVHGAGIGGLPVFDCARATALGSLLADYEFTRLKTQNGKPRCVESFEIVELDAGRVDEIERGTARAKMLADSIMFARDMVNEPSNVVTPSYLADVAREIADEAGMEISVLDRKAIEDAGMGLLAAVARGTAVEPRFIEMRYTSPGATKTIALVGKGITFDSGGYSLKSSDSMAAMKDDMAGAAAVLAAMRCVGREKPGVNVVALVPATENMIGGRAIHPGDVFTSLDGKTVEINNTDAEGRLVLADAIARARQIGVHEIIDCATLTGACVIALGREVNGIFGTKQEMVDSLIRAGASCGETIWQLPLYAEYKDDLKSDVADMKNTGSREGAAIRAALFIESFVGDVPWAHIDMSADSVDKDTPLARKGATGAPAGALIEYLLSE